MQPLNAQGLHVDLSGRPVLQGISVGFDVGVTGLVGRNGAGKTTLLRTLIGVQSPGGGLVSFRGESLEGANLQNFQRVLGWVPQEPGFPMSTSVADFLRYAAWLKGIVGGEAERAATDVLAAVDLDDRAKERIKSLSGGQRRRVALAAALVNDPEVLVLDEPTAGLDPDQREHFLHTVKASASRRVVILSTHLLEDVVAAADRLVVMHDGRVVREGALIEVLGAETLSQQDALTAARARMIGGVPDE